MTNGRMKMLRDFVDRMGDEREETSDCRERVFHCRSLTQPRDSHQSSECEQSDYGRFGNRRDREKLQRRETVVIISIRQVVEVQKGEANAWICAETIEIRRRKRQGETGKSRRLGSHETQKQSPTVNDDVGAESAVQGNEARIQILIRPVEGTVIMNVDVTESDVAVKNGPAQVEGPGANMVFVVGRRSVI